MSWTDIPDTDVDVGSYGKEDLVFTRLRDQLRTLRQTLFAWLFAEATTTSGTFVALTGSAITVFIPSMPSYSGLTRNVRLRFENKVSGGGTGTLRLRDQASGNTSAVEVTVTSAAYVEQTLDLAIDAGWVDTFRVIEVQAKTTAGTVAARSDNRIGATLDY